MIHVMESDIRLVSLYFSGWQLTWFTLVLLLMPFNWFLEIQKWRLSIPDEKLTIKQSAAAVLGGLALNWVVPFTLGDVSGRMAMVKNYKQSAIALLIIRAISLGLTLGYGGCAVLYYFDYSIAFIWLFLPTLGSYFFVLFRIYGKGSGILFVKLLALSIGRYMVFTLQFAIIIWVLIPELSLELIVVGIGWIFLFRSIIPSLFGNFGVREASALVFFAPYMDDPVAMILPCLMIWLINTIIPSIIGSGLLFNFKVKIAQ